MSEPVEAAQRGRWKAHRGVTGRKRLSIASNITWLAGASLLVKPLWLLFVVVLCWRYLGTVGFGVFSTALWLAMISGGLTDLGLTSLTVRDVARSSTSASRYFSNLLVLRMAVAPVAWIAAVGAGLALGYDQTLLVSVGWAGVYALALQTMSYVRSFYRAFENLRLEGVSTIIEKLMVVAGGCIGLFTTLSPTGTLAGMAVSMLVAVVINVVWIDRNLAKLSLRLVSPEFMKKAVATGFPIFAYSFAIMAYGRLGGILLELWHGAQVVGEFAAAYRLIEALFLLNAVFTAAVLPRLSDLFHKGLVQDFKGVLAKSLVVAVLSAVGIAAILSWQSVLILDLINPNEPTAAPAALFASFVWALPLMTAKDLLVATLLAADQERFLAWSLVGVLVSSLIFNLVLTLPLGAPGLIWVFVVVEALIIVLCLWRFARVVAARSTDPESRVSKESLDSM